MKRLLSIVLLISVAAMGMVLYPQSASASVKARGTFIASDRCPAFTSIKRETNPAKIMTSVGAQYPVLAKNKADATHYQIRVDDPAFPARWVAVNCGTAELNEDTNDNSDSNDGAQEPVAPSEPYYVLAASWQPSFCEKRPDKTECQEQTSNSYSATHLVIHGLWPQPRTNVYCGVSSELKALDKNRQWFDLPPLDLSNELREELAIKMPGYKSGLHLHEWYKHGTCYSDMPEEYYQETIALMDQLNTSDVQTLLAQNLEQDVTHAQVAQAFQDSFATGDQVSMSCSTVNGEKLLQELKIKLEGTIDDDSSLGVLMAAAHDAKVKCQEGQVDSVDEQPSIVGQDRSNEPIVSDEVVSAPSGAFNVQDLVDFFNAWSGR